MVSVIQIGEGKQGLFVVIDRTNKRAFAELRHRAKCVAAAEFLRRMLNKLSYRVHYKLTVNGLMLIPQAYSFLPGGHYFDRICREYDVEHRLTKPAHP